METPAWSMTAILSAENDTNLTLRKPTVRLLS